MAIVAERSRLELLRGDHEISATTCNLPVAAIDWRELTLLPDEKRRIEES